jgi:ferredoxin-nitrite reductase
MIDKRTGKRLGWTFLPPETLERAKSGSQVEKIKLEKDGTSAFTDIYDFAAKIRSGTLSWEDIEKDDLDFVSFTNIMSVSDYFGRYSAFSH